MSVIVYPVLGVLIVGLMGLFFVIGMQGVLMLIEAEQDRKENLKKYKNDKKN